MTEKELCPICGGKLTKAKIKENVPVEGQSLVIENVHAKVCDKCGESIVDYNEMQRITEEVAKI